VTITVIYGNEKQTVEIQGNMTIKEVMDTMDISSQTVVVKKNNEIVMEEEIAEDGDIIEVIYGG
jgi:sulfur carrier protein